MLLMTVSRFVCFFFSYQFAWTRSRAAADMYGRPRLRWPLHCMHHWPFLSGHGGSPSGLVWTQHGGSPSGLVWTQQGRHFMCGRGGRCSHYQCLQEEDCTIVCGRGGRYSHYQCLQEEDCTIVCGRGGRCSHYQLVYAGRGLHHCVWKGW